MSMPVTTTRGKSGSRPSPERRPGRPRLAVVPPASPPSHPSRRTVISALALLGLPTAALAGCSHGTDAGQAAARPQLIPSVDAAATTSPLSSSRTPAIVSSLVAAAGGGPVTKVDLTRHSISVTVASGTEPAVWTWRDGQINTSRALSTHTASQPFDPQDFALDRIPQICRTAADLAGSAHDQQVQVVEYNQGVVLMAVSTRPETHTVFFRRDGSLIAPLDFMTTAGMAEGLADAVDGVRQVFQVSYTPAGGLVVDSPTTTPGIILRRTRSARLPAWAVERKADTSVPLFSPSDLSPSVLADLLRRAPAALGHPDDADGASFVVDMRHDRTLPTIDVTVAGETMVTDLSGADITAQVR